MDWACFVVLLDVKVKCAEDRQTKENQISKDVCRSVARKKERFCDKVGEKNENGSGEEEPSGMIECAKGR